MNVGGVPNYGLKWPIKDDWNIGFETMLWKGLLGIEFDVFTLYGADSMVLLQTTHHLWGDST